VLDTATGKIVSNTTLLEPKVGLPSAAQSMNQARASQDYIKRIVSADADLQEPTLFSAAQHLAPTSLHLILLRAAVAASAAHQGTSLVARVWPLLHFRYSGRLRRLHLQSGPIQGLGG
jgi:hypothetical protein